MARPPPARSVRASPNSTTTSASRSRCRAPADMTRPPSFRVSLMFCRAACHAGTHRTGRRRAAHAARVNSSTGTLRRTSASDGSVYGGHRGHDGLTSAYASADAERRRRPSRGRGSRSSNCRAIVRARRAERRTHRHFALTRGAAGEQQVRDVRAGDEQHEPDGAEQQPQRRVFVSGVEEIVLERLDARAPARVGGRERLGDARR